MLTAVLRLVRALREGGCRTSPPEAMEAVRALERIDLSSREELRVALAATLAKSEAEAAVFRRCFDRWLDGTSGLADAARAESGDGAGRPAPPELSPLARRLLEEGRGAVVADMAQAWGGAVAAAGGGQGISGRGLAVRGFLDAMGADALARDAEALRRGGDPERMALADRLDDSRRWIVEQARRLAARDLPVVRPPSATAATAAFRAARLGTLDVDRDPRVAALAATVARKLAAEARRRRARPSGGPPDMRRLFRVLAASGGDPVSIPRAVPKPSHARLVVLCDASRSMARSTRFFLALLAGLARSGAPVEARLFSGSAIDVTAALRRGTAGNATLAAAADRCLLMPTDYGGVLREVAGDGTLRLGRRTTLLVFGDGRGNGGDPGLEALATLRRRCRRLLWLTPEPPALWGTGDSEMPAYASLCHAVVHCASASDLERVLQGWVDGA
ncbi:VWA domain-containing protein [Azospirillum sp. RWY-5-1]|uniref:VWA domain-containing protein n=1 Tax=Azospirillum oleiclasticum TaxID=2735135 RepID=A0ABX2TCC9_9PROT|nr:VWA domain-containing protein [Azospirillum oleiclasticum]NYZ20857.1 VWA domain-containing protein [Azospirillum oleiclasticum]